MLRSRRQVDLFRSRTLITALTAIAFAMLVSLAATHLHISGADQDGCEICTSVVGKLSTPVTIDAASPPHCVAFAAPDTTYRSAAPRRGLNLLPPSCGPPLAA
jgi:hypothetical protein